MKEIFSNVSELVTRQAQNFPDKIAITAQKKSWLSLFLLSSAKYETLTFKEMELRINHYAHTFLDQDLKSGDKILVFVKPSLDFPIIIFSLFRAGLVPVFIDPGMGVDAMLQCIQTSSAKALIGIPKIHHLRLLKSSYFSSIEFSYVIDGRALNAISFENLLKKNYTSTPLKSQTTGQSYAAVLFTSGGTGTPKGVLYTHEMFIEQTLKLKQIFRLANQDKDYPCFPLFGLFSLALGLTVVMPEVDLMKPSQVNAKAIVKSLMKHKITFATGSPALWKRVAQYALRKKITLPHLKAIATFGAPVSIDLHKDLSSVLTAGEVYTPYGATECLPVSVITSHEILGETKTETLGGQGTCVGYPAPTTEIKILNCQSNTIVDDINYIGEILVATSAMTSGYDGLSDATKAIRYVCPISQKKYHKMGDLGKLDCFGRLWFLGRKVQCISLPDYWLCTEEIEPAINYLPEVSRCALLKLKDKIALVVERQDGMVDLPDLQKEKFFQKIKMVLAGLPKGHLVEDIILDMNFPVDTRHNIKIDRLSMANALNQRSLNQRMSFS